MTIGGPSAGDVSVAESAAEPSSSRFVQSRSAVLGADRVSVSEGQNLVVQACRRSGDAASVDLSVNSIAIEPVDERLSLVNVGTPAPSDVTELSALGLDLTEHAGEGFVQVVAGPTTSRRSRPRATNTTSSSRTSPRRATASAPPSPSTRTTSRSPRCRADARPTAGSSTTARS
jgi:hypothetical protein